MFLPELLSKSEIKAICTCLILSGRGLLRHYPAFQLTMFFSSRTLLTFLFASINRKGQRYFTTEKLGAVTTGLVSSQARATFAGSSPSLFAVRQIQESHVAFSNATIEACIDQLCNIV